MVNTTLAIDLGLQGSWQNFFFFATFRLYSDNLLQATIIIETLQIKFFLPTTVKSIAEPGWRWPPQHVNKVGGANYLVHKSSHFCCFHVDPVLSITTICSVCLQLRKPSSRQST